jgi:putative ABC transport system ATP-binding protein
MSPEEISISKNSEGMMNLLKELHREGAIICMVTRDPRYGGMADRSIHLADGRVVDEVGRLRPPSGQLA